MCSILGASFAPNSTINRRQLANALLSEGQVRGRDASGYAWLSPTEGDGVYKRATPGGQLSVGLMPKDASAMILHTRAATHGHESDNDNNHPVISPSGRIRLVHNGVLYNHDTMRGTLGKIGKSLPDVDTSVLPATLEVLGLEGTELIEGDAAAAWFDSETGDVLHLARFSHSPIVIVTLEDGTAVFASTANILFGALNRLGLRWFGSYPKPYYEFDEGEYIQLQDGIAVVESTVDWGEDYFADYRGWRSVTSGATTKNNSTTGGWAGIDDSDEVWDRAEPGDRAYALTSSATTPSDEDSVKGVNDRFYEGQDVPPVFWIEDHDGDRAEFTSLVTMLASVRWHAGILPGAYELVDPDSGDMRWVNHFRDIGEINLDDGEYVSWVGKPNEMEDYGSSIPSFLRDGIDVLRKVDA